MTSRTSASRRKRPITLRPFTLGHGTSRTAAAPPSFRDAPRTSARAAARAADRTSVGTSVGGSTRGSIRASVVVAVSVAVLAVASVASAHAILETSEPAKNASLDAAPSEVSLHFTERVETAFSVFKVYALDSGGDPSAPATAPLEGVEALRLNGLAGTLVDQVLLERGDEDAAARVDTGLEDTPSTSADVRIALGPDLPPGDYVVMWRVLSEDTHTTQGYFVFRVLDGAD